MKVGTWMIAIACASACARLPPSEGPIIRRIELRGLASRHDATALLARLASKPHTKLERDRLAADLKTVWASKLVDDVRVEEREQGRGVALTLVVRERPFVRKLSVEYLGTSDHMTTTRGLVRLDANALHEWVAELRDFNRRAGYLFVEVRTQVEAADAHGVNVKVLIDRKQPVEAQLRFDGAHALSAQQLTEALHLKHSTELFDEDARDHAALALTAAYYDLGYVKAQVDAEPLATSDDRKSTTVAFHVTEGEQFHVGHLEARGDVSGDASSVLRVLGQVEGEVFKRSKIVAGLEQIRRPMRDAGYAHGDVTPTTALDDTQHTVDITLDVKRGARMRIGAVKIEGVGAAQSASLAHTLKVHPGEWYRETAIEESKAALEKLDTFSSIEVATHDSVKPGELEVVFAVSPRALAAAK